MRSRLGRRTPRTSSGLSFILVSLFLASLAQTARGQYLVVDDAGHVLGKRPERKADVSPGGPGVSFDPACGLFMVAFQGEPVPGGGTLNPMAQGTPVAMNAAGETVFFSQIDGSPRNKGIFLADATGLHPIAIGCGGYLGSGDPGTACGDPAPIGGTFTGFYPGSALPPTLNDEGDVLFLADVYGGTSPRGLFLYRKATDSIVKVAAIGDLTPAGVLVGVGVGSLNNHGEVVFLGALGAANEQTAILHWENGVIKTVVKPGDEIPGGTVYTLVWIGAYKRDGTYVPFIEVPDINDAGAVSFQALLNTGGQGLYVSRDGVHELYVSTGQPSPAGGVFSSLYAPILNEAGEIAFEGEYATNPWTVGWFVGRPGKWRKVVSFYDPMLGGQVWGLAVSHNPQQAIDNDGNLIIWTDVRLDDGTDIDAVHIGHADGTLETVARTGDPTPVGGMLRDLHEWPTLWSRRCSLGASLLGTTTFSAHMEFLNRPLQVEGLSVGPPDPASGETPVTWEPQLAPADGSLVHDVLRGTLGGFKQATACAAADVPGASWPEPAAGCPAGAGDGCWYLVRAEDTCGRGSYGAAGTVCVDPCDGGPIPGCPVCGNQVIEGSEECDGMELGGETCVSQGFDSGTLGCSPTCTLDRSGCTTVCGDGIIRGNEECDGSNLRGRLCIVFGFDDGILTCSSTCTFDLSGCCCTDGTPGCPVCPVCGDGVRDAPYELCDGADLGPATCTSQGHLPGTLLCNATCDGFIYTGCIGL